MNNSPIYGDACVIRKEFCLYNDEGFRDTCGKHMFIGIDREDCYDKFSKCPIILPVPRSQKQLDFINRKIEWLKTAQGYKVSNEFIKRKWITKYPKSCDINE